MTKIPLTGELLKRLSDISMTNGKISEVISDLEVSPGYLIIDSGTQEVFKKLYPFLTECKALRAF